MPKLGDGTQLSLSVLSLPRAIFSTTQKNTKRKKADKKATTKSKFKSS